MPTYMPPDLSFSLTFAPIGCRLDSGRGVLKKTDSYHHGDLRATLIRLGIGALESEGADKLSLRSLAEKAGVSKTAPYRHFPDREAFLGALADEGNHILFMELEKAASARSGARGDMLAEMGRSYMAFALAHPALYRLMYSPLICTLPDELMVWARRSLALLGESLARASTEPGDEVRLDHNAAAAAWGYIHGLALLRIDGLFPESAGAPDWDYLAAMAPAIPSPKAAARGKT